MERYMKLVVLWISLGLLSLFVGAWGCGTGNPFPPGSYERGVFFAEKGKNLEAVSAFETYLRKNPTDSLAADAQFKKAMTYMTMKEYPLAVVEFQILRKDYPTSPRIEEALYREGMAYLHQVGRVERDISGAYQARVHFQEFLSTYPNSSYKADVERANAEISDLIVAKRLREIKVYKARHKFRAVATTMDMVLQTEPNSSLLDKVLWERAAAAYDLHKTNEGNLFLEELVRRFPDSSLATKAQKKLGSTQAALADSLRS